MNQRRVQIALPMGLIVGEFSGPKELFYGEAYATWLRETCASAVQRAIEQGLRRGDAHTTLNIFASEWDA